MHTCHCNRLWAHHSRNFSDRSETSTTGSNHLDDLAFQFSARFVQAFTRYSHTFIPTTWFEQSPLSRSNHVLLLLFLSYRRRFTGSITSQRFVAIRRLLHPIHTLSQFDHIDNTKQHLLISRQPLLKSFRYCECHLVHP